jgi:NAD(P)-dependent dehydrogenase (short-subunit alcohol dehydrogenase family)
MSTLELGGRVVLISGAAHGIGRATVDAVRARGGIPVCLDLAGEALDLLGRELGDGGLAAACSVVDAAGVSAVVEEAVARFGGIDVVVANAGVERIDPCWVMSPEDFEEVLNVNILGLYRTVRPALPHVMRRKGHVVAVSSVSALVPWPFCAAYGASKAFVGSFMRSLRAEMQGTGTTAGAVYFGYVDTGMMGRARQRPAAEALFDRAPSFIGKVPRSPEYAAQQIVHNIERRAALGFSHASVKLLLGLRGVAELFDDLLTRHLGIPEMLEKHYRVTERPT